MFEVAESGHHHGNAVFVAIFYGVVVADRSAGLYHSVNPCVVGYFNTVGKREECIRCHYGAIEVEIECAGLFNCLAQCVDT